MGVCLGLVGSLYTSKPLKDIPSKTIVKINQYFAQRVNVHEFYDEDDRGLYDEVEALDDYFWDGQYYSERTNKNKPALCYLLAPSLCSADEKVYDWQELDETLNFACKPFLDCNFNINIENVTKYFSLLAGKMLDYKKEMKSNPNSDKAKRCYAIGDNKEQLCLKPSELVKIKQNLKELVASADGEVKQNRKYDLEKFSEVLQELFNELINPKQTELLKLNKNNEHTPDLLNKLDDVCSFAIDGIEFELAFSIVIQ